MLSWGIEVNVWLQSFGTPALDAALRAITFIGNTECYLLLLPLVYWCFNKRAGIRLALVFLASAYLCYVLKQTLGTPRPFQVAPERVRAMASTSTYGFPSAHAMVTTVVWGFLATRARGRFWIAGVGVPLAVGVSRLYLGVHFPSDVFGGWLIGAAVLAAFVATERRLAESLASLPPAAQVALCLFVPLGLALACFDAETVKIAAALCGASVGLVLERRFVRFSVEETRARRTLRFVAGAVVALGAHAGLKYLMTPGADATPAVTALLAAPRYLFTGFWVAFAGPWMFVRMRLSRPETPA